MIPKGATDECQPLDRRLFGNMMNKAKSIHQKKVARKVLESMISGMELGSEKQDRKYACHVFSAVWKTLTSYQIENAWNIAIYGQKEAAKMFDLSMSLHIIFQIQKQKKTVFYCIVINCNKNV